MAALTVEVRLELGGQAHCRAVAFGETETLHQSGAQVRFWWRAADAPLEGAGAAPSAGQSLEFPPQRSAVPDPAASQPVPDDDPANYEVPAPPAAAAARRPRRSLTPLVTAVVGGGMLFAALSGFGRVTRIVDPLPRQIDATLAAAGFGINEIALSGHRYTLDTDIFAALGLDDTQTFARFDASAARARIEALPWVDTATVNRLLPDQLRIEIRERQPMAVWVHDGREALIDQRGRVLASLTPGSAPHLPRFAGMGAASAASALLAALSRHPELARRVETSIRVGERRWSLVLAGNIKLELPADLEAEALERISGGGLAGVDLNHMNQIVDLRLGDRITIRGAAPLAGADPIQPGTARRTM